MQVVGDVHVGRHPRCNGGLLWGLELHSDGETHASGRSSRGGDACREIVCCGVLGKRDVYDHGSEAGSNAHADEDCRAEALDFSVSFPERVTLSIDLGFPKRHALAKQLGRCLRSTRRFELTPGNT